MISEVVGQCAAFCAEGSDLIPWCDHKSFFRLLSLPFTYASNGALKERGEAEMSHYGLQVIRQMTIRFELPM